MTATAPIRDRITELRRVKASDLLANPKNWRKHPQGQAAALSAVLREVGYADALLARETPHGLELIDGHLRQKLTPDQEVPVLVLDVTEDEANKILLTLDPLAAMAEGDKAALDKLLHEVTTGDAGLQEMLAGLATENGLSYGAEPLPAPEPEIDRAEELQRKWGTELGQLWQIGKHRLLCGDSTNPQDVQRLLIESEARAIVTSPPYGVGMEYEGVPNQQDTIDLVSAAFKTWCERLVTGGFAFVNFGERYIWDIPMVQVYHALFKSIGMRWYDQRFWKRSNVGMAIWNTTQPRAMSQCEYLFTFQKGTNAYPVNDLSISKEQLWDAEGSSATKGHPAVMALGIAVRAIKIYTQPNDVVGEPFSGSGTTMCAAEQTGRVCYGVEIEPKYVAVTLERLSQMNLEPKLIERGAHA